MSISSISSTGYAPGADSAAKVQPEREPARFDTAAPTGKPGDIAAAAAAEQDRPQVAKSVGALVDLYL